MHLALSCHTHTHTFTQPKWWLNQTIGMQMTDRYQTAIMQIMNDYWYDAWEDCKLVQKTGLLIHYSWLKNALLIHDFLCFHLRQQGTWSLVLFHYVQMGLLSPHHGPSRFNVIYMSLYNTGLRDKMKVCKLLNVTPTYSIYPVISIHIKKKLFALQWMRSCATRWWWWWSSTSGKTLTQPCDFDCLWAPSIKITVKNKNASKSKGDSCRLRMRHCCHGIRDWIYLIACIGWKQVDM